MKVLLGLLHCQILCGVCGNGQAAGPVSEVLLESMCQGFVSYVFSRRSAKSSSALNIMLSVVSLVDDS